MWSSGEEYSQFALTSRKNVRSLIKLKTCGFEEGLRLQTERRSPVIN